MSGIAGIVHFDGAPLEPGLVEKMTNAMVRRGPDGIHHWVNGSIGLGQCMLRTTPGSLEEIQPLTNDDGNLVLVMDGRVDNGEDLRTNLLECGSVLRDRSDAEMVLRAYEAWGEDCPSRIIGEFVFFIWDARQRRLFGARDAAGTRHFYYHKGNGWFAFASEIKALLALKRIEPRLNESRMLDYLVFNFNGDDGVGTFYQGIDKMPAGHAMRIMAQGTKVWRYWDPGSLPAITFASLDDCADAFLEQLRVTVKCRLRCIGQVGAMLSGGLDSSSIVGLINKEFRSALRQPLRTFSMIWHDRENCLDWLSIQKILSDDWIEATVLSSDISSDICQSFREAALSYDEPTMFTNGLGSFVISEAARSNGCRIVFDGLAGDLLFYGVNRTLDVIFRRRLYTWLPATLAAFRRHGSKGGDWHKKVARRCMASLAPKSLRTAYRILRYKRADVGNDINLLRPQVLKRLLEKRRLQLHETYSRFNLRNDQIDHARIFTSGILSFAHEHFGEIALSREVEPRSPYSDRRMLEFAIQMPIEAKLFAQWYKYILRQSMKDILPEEVRWRRTIHGHPGWKFSEVFTKWAVSSSQGRHLHRNMYQWVDREALDKMRGTPECERGVLRIMFLSEWLNRRGLLNGIA